MPLPEPVGHDGWCVRWWGKKWLSCQSKTVLILESKKSYHVTGESVVPLPRYWPEKLSISFCKGACSLSWELNLIEIHIWFSLFLYTYMYLQVCWICTNVCWWYWRWSRHWFPCLAIFIMIVYHFANAVASWLVRSTPEQAVRVRALAGDIVLCSWARHFTLTVPLSTQVYKWVPVGGNPAMD